MRFRWTGTTRDFPSLGAAERSGVAFAGASLLESMSYQHADSHACMCDSMTGRIALLLRRLQKVQLFHRQNLTIITSIRFRLARG